MDDVAAARPGSAVAELACCLAVSATEHVMMSMSSLGRVIFCLSVSSVETSLTGVRRLRRTPAQGLCAYKEQFQKREERDFTRRE